MSRLILKPTLVLDGDDPATGYGVRYNSDSGLLEIGCEAHTLREWKRDGAEIITDSSRREAAAVCKNPSCLICRGRREAVLRKSARNYVRLQKLIDRIEAAESALEKSLRSQTKRA